MTGRHVALLRGINVGKAKRVAMADLRALFEDLGYREVRTLLNSGNVVFSTPSKLPVKAASRIQAAMAAKLGVSARIMLLSAAQLATVVAENPLGKIAKDPSRLLVCVLADPADRSKLKPMLKQDWGQEAVAVGTHAAYVWCPGGTIGSPAYEALTRALGDAVTGRNWATVLKLQAMMEP